MKVTIPLALLLLLAAAIGYLLGTENGRAQRDLVLVKLGYKESETNEAEASAPLDAPAGEVD